MTTKFVGREKELGQLEQELRAAAGGAGACVVLSGEAGVGKTRLVQEVVARHTEVQYLPGKCFTNEGGEPYLPFIEALGRLADTAAAAADTSAGTAAEDLGLGASMGLIGVGMGAADSATEAPRPGRLDFTGEKGKMFDMVASTLRTAGKAKPVVLFIDDLQWADSATLQLLQYVARAIKDARVLLVAAYRPEEADVLGEKHPLPTTLQRLIREGLARQAKLERLPEADTFAMLRAIFARDDLPWDFVHRVYAETEGNPYFVEEVAKSLVEQGVVRPGEARVLVDGATFQIPTTVKDIVARRIEQLEENARKVLEVLAVVGRESTYDVLLASSGVDEETLVEALDRLLEAKMIQEAAGEKEVYRFTHQLLREVTYGNLSRAKKRLVHRKVLAALEQSYRGRTEAIIYALAHHAENAGDPQKTLEYARPAGDRALARFGFDEALRYYKAALEAAGQVAAQGGPVAADAEVALLLKAGRATEHTGDWRAGQQYYMEVVKLLETDSVEKAQAFRRMGHLDKQRAEWKNSLANFEKGLVISERLGDTAGVADTYSGMAWVAWRQGDFERSVEYGQKCIQAAQAINDQTLVAQAKIDIGNCYNELVADYDTALRTYEEAKAILETTNDLSQLPRCLNNIGDVYMKKGEFGKAIEYFQKTIAISEKTGEVRNRGYSTANTGESYFKMGAPEKAIGFIQEALKIFERIDDKYMIAQCLSYTGVHHKFRKEWAMADQFFQRAVKIMEEVNSPWGLATVLLEYGSALKEKGDRERARAQLERASELYRRLGSETQAEIARMEMESV